MKNSEIRALQENCKWQMDTFDKISYDNTVALMSLAETLLARQAEVLEEVGSEDGTFCYKCQCDVEFDAEYYCPQCRCYAFYHDRDRRIRAILDPQPAASIRDIADRHSFAPMPPDLGQRNIDDHTTTAALAEEATNGN